MILNCKPERIERGEEERGSSGRVYGPSHGEPPGIGGPGGATAQLTSSLGLEGVPKKPGVHEATEGCQLPNAVRSDGSQLEGKAMDAPSIILLGLGYVSASIVAVDV
jgi:hypothetical protein